MTSTQEIVPGLDELNARLTESDDPNVPYEPALSAVHRSVHSYVYRIPGVKTGREHHLLSRLEYHAFLYFEFFSYLNIREQFAIPLELSRYMAARLGIRHPCNWKLKADVPVTSDFVLSLPGGGWLAIDVKPSDKLESARVQEKMTLASACWALMRQPAPVRHMVTTEKDQDPITVANYEVLHPLALPICDSPFSDADTERASDALRRILDGGKVTIRDAAAICDRETGLGRGRLCLVALWLIARRRWRVDVTRAIGPDHCVTFLP